MPTWAGAAHDSARCHTSGVSLRLRGASGITPNVPGIFGVETPHRGVVGATSALACGTHVRYAPQLPFRDACKQDRTQRPVRLWQRTQVQTVLRRHAHRRLSRAGPTRWPRPRLPSAQSRSCGSCTRCCDGWLQGEIRCHPMYPGRRCHFVAEGGCGIYDERPQSPCRSFVCGWMQPGSALPQDWRSDRVGVIVVNTLWRGAPAMPGVGRQRPRRRDARRAARVRVDPTHARFSTSRRASASATDRLSSSRNWRRKWRAANDCGERVARGEFDRTARRGWRRGGTSDTSS